MFGLNLETTEKQLEEAFGQFGKINKINLIKDRKTNRSKGFAFLYFENLDDAIKAKEKGHGLIIDGNSVRTDYSFTNKEHSPTPGRYMGNYRRRYYDRYDRYDRYHDRDRYDRGYDRGYDRYDRGYDRRRSPYYYRDYDDRYGRGDYYRSRGYRNY